MSTVDPRLSEHQESQTTCLISKMFGYQYISHTHLEFTSTAMATAGSAIYIFQSVIRGHHISKAIWTPAVEEDLQVSREPNNLYDIHAVAVLKNGITVGHVPMELSRVFSSLLLNDGHISFEIVGHQRYGLDLEVSQPKPVAWSISIIIFMHVQVSCMYKLRGQEEE